MVTDIEEICEKLGGKIERSSSGDKMCIIQRDGETIKISPWKSKDYKFDKYLVFVAEDYYPAGGFGDIRKTGEDLSKLVEEAINNVEEFESWQIIDVTSGEGFLVRKSPKPSYAWW